MQEIIGAHIRNVFIGFVTVYSCMCVTRGHDQTNGPPAMIDAHHTWRSNK